MQNTDKLAVRTRVLPVMLVTSLFFLWGMANNLNDILIRQFKKAFELTDFHAGLVQSAFYLGYFLFAIPAGLFMRRYGYKGGIVLGLALYAAGAFLFYPAAEARMYGLFLLALFVIASGLAFLETSANPFVTVLGPAESAARRLNLAQAFNPLGSITGVLVGRMYIFSGIEHTPEQIAAMSQTARNAYFAAESSAVEIPYLMVGIVVVLLALVIKVVQFAAVGESGELSEPGKATWHQLARRKGLSFAVVAQFFYVGAQVGVWSYLIRYAQVTIPGTPEKTAADFLILSLVLFMIGRFVGTALMRIIAPAKLLTAYALMNVLLITISISWPGHIGLYALIATSFFMSIMFPTIFALGLRGLGESRKLASSLLVMSIVGGAVLTPLMGAVSGYAGIDWSMGVPLFCFIVIACFAAYTTGGAVPD
ncbi:MAG: L-fucose:H+ symporter permease [Pseudomonadota bacterium]|nr:L-fucose:H+ symporter permease [Pseudomonadota bacterium]